MQSNLFCISDEEMAAERAALSPTDRAVVDALPKAPTATQAARRLPYTGSFPRKRHYHVCETCRARGKSNGVNCYKQRCVRPVSQETCGWCK